MKAAGLRHVAARGRMVQDFQRRRAAPCRNVPVTFSLCVEGSTVNEIDFGFTAEWYTLGIVTPARLAALQDAWSLGEDRNTEHYRWRAFREFVAERRPLSSQITEALYILGTQDADRAMGESMMNFLVKLPECPEPVLAMARTSGIRHLIKAAEQRGAA